MLTSDHSWVGRFDIWTGSCDFSGVQAWHGRQFLTVYSTLWLIPGNHTFSRRSCLVFTTPWWPSWTKIRTLCSRVAGSMICDPLSSSIPSLLVLSSCCTRLRACRAGLSAAGVWWMAGVHCPVWSASTAHWRTQSALVASLISCSVTAFGVALADRKLMYYWATFSWWLYVDCLQVGVAGHVVSQVVLSCTIHYCEVVGLQLEVLSLDAGRWLWSRVVHD